jgi:hypothetical protein
LDRASIFSDDKVIERLNTEFIPYSGNCAELQFERSPASKWFMSVARKVNHRALVRETTQGFYTCAADGTAYAFWNNRDTPKVLRQMDAALKNFKSAPPAKVDISEADLKAAYARTPAADASVLRTYSRIRPLPPNAHALNAGVGRDHVWISSAEWKPLENLKEEGEERPLPPVIAQRMARFHLIDNVRGELDMWKPEQVQIHACVTLEKKSDAVRAYRLSATFSQSLPDGKRGQEGWLVGYFEIPVATGKISRFRAYSEGQAWGVSTFTQHAPPGKFPLLIAIVETDDWVSKVVPPQAVWIDDYANPKVADKK